MEQGNDFASLPEGGGNEMEQEAESYTCIVICLKPDGTASVAKTTQPAPEGGEEVGSIDEALQLAATMAEEGDDPAMDAAQTGYDRMKPPAAKAGMALSQVFGEG
jgi:hypothetical protein